MGTPEGHRDQRHRDRPAVGQGLLHNSVDRFQVKVWRAVIHYAHKRPNLVWHIYLASTTLTDRKPDAPAHRQCDEYADKELFHGPLLGVGCLLLLYHSE